MPLARSLAGDAMEAVRLVQVACGSHVLVRVELDHLRTVRARPVDCGHQQPLAKTVPALRGAEIHPLQLERVPAEIAERDRADHLSVGECHPEGRVHGAGINEIRIDLRIRLEPELAQRVADERAKPLRVIALERHDRDSCADIRVHRRASLVRPHPHPGVASDPFSVETVSGWVFRSRVSAGFLRDRLRPLSGLVLALWLSCLPRRLP